MLLRLPMPPRPRNIRLVAFDLDGTLVDAYRAITDSVNHMMRVMGRPEQSHRKVKRSVGWGVDGLVRTFVEEDRVSEALALFREHHDARLRKELKLLPGARPLLTFLKARGCVLAVASNRPEKFCRIILSTLGIEGYFDHVVCGDMVPRAKPWPDVLVTILRQARVPATQAVFVGDMSVDVLCGRRARVFTVGVPTGSCTLAEVRAANPDMIIPRLSALRGLFRNG